MMIFEKTNQSHIERPNSKQLLKEIFDARETPQVDAAYPAAQNNYVNVIQLLMQYGANLTQQNNKGLSLLHLAALDGRIETIKLLAEYKVDFNQVDNEGFTPVHYAVIGNQSDIIKMLVEYKTDLNKACNKDVVVVEEGGTPLDFAVASGNSKVAKALLNSKADVNQALTAVNTAVKRGDAGIVKMLAEYRVDLNQKGNDIFTPAHFTVLNEDSDLNVIKELIQYKAHFNMRVDDTVGSPIKFALLKQNWHALVLILMNIKNSSDLYPKDRENVAKHRDELADAFIDLAKKMDNPEREKRIQQVINSENALGMILNISIKNTVSRIFETQKSSKHIKRIVSELNYDSQSKDQNPHP